jgi:peroxiredoxin Q/BCP
VLDRGDKAPDFTLPDQHGNPVSLADLRGKDVVLYFYPKADTPGHLSSKGEEPQQSKPSTR